MTGWKLSVAEKAELVRLYRAGWSIANLARAYDIAHQSARELLVTRQVELRPYGRPTRKGA